MTKRSGPSSASLALKKQKLADELAGVEEQEADKEHDKVLSQLMELIVGDTAVIKKCIAHVEVLRTGHAKDKEHFPKTYIYVSKVPKDYNLKTLLPAMSKTLTKQVLVDASKHDKRVDLKLCYYGALMSSEQKIMNHEKKQYLDIMCTRHTEIGSPLNGITFNKDKSVNWDASGVFELLPKMQESEAVAGEKCGKAKSDAEGHRYTKVRCKVLKANMERDLPDAYNVTGRWVIKENYRLATVLSTPADAKPQVRVRTYDLFKDSLEFRELMESLPVYGKREQNKKLAEGSGSSKDKKEEELSPEEKKKLKMKSALGRLRRNIK